MYIYIYIYTSIYICIYIYIYTPSLSFSRRLTGRVNLKANRPSSNMQIISFPFGDKDFIKLTHAIRCSTLNLDNLDLSIAPRLNSNLRENPAYATTPFYLNEQKCAICIFSLYLYLACQYKL